MLTLLLLACTGVPDDTAFGDDTSEDDTGDTCPGLDCRDSLTVTFLDPSGTPTGSFFGDAQVDGVGVATFNCNDASSTFEGGLCLGEGRLELWVYAAVVSFAVFTGDDAPEFRGDVTPAWTAPYDSEECGHYCYIAEETAQLASVGGA